MVRQLIRENAQLKMEIAGIRRELEKLKREPPDLAESPDRAVTIIIDSIRNFSDDGERQLQIGELKRELPDAETHVQKAQKKYADMIEKNAHDKNLWDHRRYPYHGDRKPGARWEPPHSNQVLATARMEIDRAEKRRTLIERTIKKLERGPTDLQILVKGSSVSPDDNTPSKEVQVMFEGSQAKRIQTKRNGDCIRVTGLTTESDDGYIAMDARSFTDAILPKGPSEPEPKQP
jgi:hypothetical protein